MSMMFLVIGGHFYNQNSEWIITDTVDVWDPESESWTLSSELKLDKPKYEFGALSVPTRLICP